MSTHQELTDRALRIAAKIQALLVLEPPGIQHEKFARLIDAEFEDAPKTTSSQERYE